MTKQKGLWDLNREELLREAEARELMVHSKWTNPENRSVIESAYSMPRLDKMTLAELEMAAATAGMSLSVKANKRVLMRMLRDNGGMGPQTLMTFGRFKG